MALIMKSAIIFYTAVLLYIQMFVIMLYRKRVLKYEKISFIYIYIYVIHFMRL